MRVVVRVRAFVAALTSSATAPTIALRRTLEGLSPQLFGAYMEWCVRRRAT